MAHFMGGSRGGTGGRESSPEKSQNYRISLQYWSISPENHKATKPAFNVGTFHWRFTGGPMMAQLKR